MMNVNPKQWLVRAHLGAEGINVEVYPADDVRPWDGEDDIPRVELTGTEWSWLAYKAAVQLAAETDRPLGLMKYNSVQRLRRDEEAAVHLRASQSLIGKLKQRAMENAQAAMEHELNAVLRSLRDELRGVRQ